MNTAVLTSDAPPRPVDRLIAEYGDSHQNMTNRIIHWFCVPLITWSTLGLMYVAHPWLAYGFCILAMIYYLRLSLPLAIGMALFASGSLYSFAYVPQLLWVCLAVWVTAWIVQFVGHKIEGKKPSFLKDVFFLLIGPIYLLHFIYKHLGIKY
jgi:uncharacterized membrane protein YGL010W